MQLRRGVTRYKHYLQACFYTCLMLAMTLWTFKRGQYDLTILNLLGCLGFIWLATLIRKVLDDKKDASTVRRYTRSDLINKINSLEADFENSQPDLDSDLARGYAMAVRDIKTKVFHSKSKPKPSKTSQIGSMSDA